ncbi:hypothetical protein ACROYT_G006803 [Oculina patagonica]
MKSVLIALLLVVAVLLVTAEPRRRGGKGRPGGLRPGGPRPGGRRPGGPRPWQKKFRECHRNCSDCQEGACRACDDDFALKTITLRRFNKTVSVCVPCGRRLKMKNPALFLEQCVTECPRNCTTCEDGSCKICDDGFFNVETRLLQRKICVSCGPRMKKNWPDVYVKECSQNGCGRGCANCPEPGVCTECEEDLKLFTPPGSNITRCIKNCPPFYTLEKGSSPPRCEVKQITKPNNKCGKTCAACTEQGICTECLKPSVLIKFGDRSMCRQRCPFHFRKFVDPKTRATICEKLNKQQRKGGRKNLSDPF